METLKRILIAVVIAIIVALIVYGLGIIFTLLPVVAPIGDFLKAISTIVGVLFGIYWFVTKRSLVR